MASWDFAAHASVPTALEKLASASPKHALTAVIHLLLRQPLSCAVALVEQPHQAFPFLITDPNLCCTPSWASSFSPFPSYAFLFDNQHFVFAVQTSSLGSSWSCSQLLAFGFPSSAFDIILAVNLRDQRPHLHLNCFELRQ
jgi:hypothetical protein